MIQRGNAMPPLPQKLKQDAIVEALFELRFEHETIGEVVVGQLVSAAPWSGYRSARLPLAELPTSIRDADADLRHQPIIQLQRPTPGEIIKIGPRVVSLHVLSPYPGWDVFQARIAALISELFKVTGSPYIARAALRYVNAVSGAHGIGAISELNFRFEVNGIQPSNELSASYRFQARPQIRGQVTLASPSHVVGAVPPGAVAFIDLEMTTATPLGHIEQSQLVTWVEEAHLAEKEAFFALLPDDKLEELRER